MALDGRLRYRLRGSALGFYLFIYYYCSSIPIIIIVVITISVIILLIVGNSPKRTSN